MIRIIIPPISDCFMPTLGAAQIVGYLKAHNIKTKLYDANQELMYSIVDHINCTSDYPKVFYKNDSQYHKLKQYTAAFSAKYAPVRIAPDDFSANIDWRDIDALTDFLNFNDAWTNVFDQLSCIKEALNNDIVGLSISYEMQLIPALIIAKKIKDSFPQSRIVLGGSFFYNYESEFLNTFCTLSFIDFVIIGCGELVFEAIHNDSLEQIHKLKIWDFDDRKILDAKQVCSPTVYIPDFSDIDFSRYPSDSKAFPYMINNRCYYGKCKFCNGDKVSDDVQSKNVTEAFENICKIASKININNIYIVDAALSPKALSVISKMDMRDTIHWIANARFDKALLDTGLIEGIASRGCEMLRFGLETGSQQVLDLMSKGTEIAVAEKILKKTYFQGIKNHVYLMFGYLGETEENRRETLDFLNRNKEYIYSYSISFFQPMPCTPVYKDLLPFVQNKEEPYDEMINIIYGDEDNYKRILNSAEQAAKILSGYAHTNGEHYSANIFGQNSNCAVQNEVTIFTSPILHDTADNNISAADFKNRISIQQFNCSSPQAAYICDFFKNIFITLRADKKYMSLLNASYSGSIEELLSEFDNNQKISAIDFLRIISYFSDCVILNSKIQNDNLTSVFSVSNLNEFDFGDNCIQFTPIENLK